MTDTKTLKQFRKQAMNTLVLDLNILKHSIDVSKWMNAYTSNNDVIHNFLTKAIKRKTKAPEYKKLKKEVEVLIKWGALKDDFGYTILKRYGYETYLKLYQDLDGTHGVMNDVITISDAEDCICCYM